MSVCFFKKNFSNLFEENLSELLNVFKFFKTLKSIN